MKTAIATFKTLGVGGEHNMLVRCKVIDANDVEPPKQVRLLFTLKNGLRFYGMRHKNVVVSFASMAKIQIYAVTNVAAWQSAPAFRDPYAGYRVAQFLDSYLWG